MLYSVYSYFLCVSVILKAVLCIFRELREKEEIEKYRMERPKIQQQFSDLKVQSCTCFFKPFKIRYPSAVICYIWLSVFLGLIIVYPRKLQIMIFQRYLCSLITEEVGRGVRGGVAQHPWGGRCKEQTPEEPPLRKTHPCPRQLLLQTPADRRESYHCWPAARGQCWCKNVFPVNIHIETHNLKNNKM